MRTFVLFLIGLTFGGAGGFVYAAANGITLDGHDHASHGAVDHAAMGHGGGDHAAMHDTPLDVAAADAPRLEIAVTKDPMSGYNLHVMPTQFAFAPEGASKAHIDGQGHAHVYANGVKLGRLYGAWMHLDQLPKGAVEISVTLNSNDHRPFAVNGQPISATQTITVD